MSVILSNLGINSDLESPTEMNEAEFNVQGTQ